MERMFSISDDESETETETSEARQDSGPKKNNSGSLQKTNQHITVPEKLKGEQLWRHRNLSMNDEDLLETGAADESDLFRRRSRSAPPAFWAAKKYGRQLRRMSDEFDILLDKGMKRVKSAGTARQMRQSPSWFAFLWSHKESDAESRHTEWSTVNEEREKRTTVHNNWWRNKRMHCCEESDFKPFSWTALRPVTVEKHDWFLTGMCYPTKMTKNGESPQALGILCSKSHEYEKLNISLLKAQTFCNSATSVFIFRWNSF